MRTLLAAAVVLCSSVLALAQQRSDLTGVVRGKDAKPVAGATVYVWTAGVKSGYSTYCPSCYLDCGKHATTGAEGTFTIPSLDPDLIFRLLVVAEGHQPQFVPKVDPVTGAQVEVHLERREPAPETSARVLRGTVKDAKGRPVAGAAVSPEMVYWKAESGQLGGRGGAVEGLDPLAVTNERGEFELAYKDATTAWDIEIKARGFARQMLRDQKTGTPCAITLREGGTLTGRLVRDGKPVPYVQMGICHSNRIAGQFLGHDVIGTDGEGRFTFSSVPVGAEWYLYATMESTKQIGATRIRTACLQKDGEVLDVGEVALEPGYRLRGRVMLSDGMPIPQGMRIHISHWTAWDTQLVDLPPDGSFEFTGLCRDSYYIFPSVAGYHLSNSNPSLSAQIEGLIERDIDEFIIVMEPGRGPDNHVAGKHKDEPLRSAKAP